MMMRRRKEGRKEGRVRHTLWFKVDRTNTLQGGGCCLNKNKN